MDNSYPILEFDTASEAMIEPSRVYKPVAGLPERCVLCFFKEVIASVCANARVIAHLEGESGKNPIYVLEVEDNPHPPAPSPSGRRGEKQLITVVHPGVGAPLAAGYLEEMIAHGCRKFIACGGAGVLNGDIAVGHVVVPSSAVRDEGTSYHYLPPGREVAASAEGLTAIQTTLEAHEVPYIVGKTWTTDGVYRETPAKVARRKAEGCLTVEMEAAAFFAVAQFRGVTFAQLLYGGDNLGGDVWDHRDWLRQASTREKLFWLATEACLKL